MCSNFLKYRSMRLKETQSYSSRNVEQKWYQIDATGLRLGRLATQVAVLLQGKHKVHYTPHNDIGDYVVVYNCDAIECTSKDKIYYRHSGRMGGLKERTYEEQKAVSSCSIVELAVKRMLKRSPLGRKMLKKLKCFSGEHSHEAQQPQTIVLSAKTCLTKGEYSESN